MSTGQNTKTSINPYHGVDPVTARVYRAQDQYKDAAYALEDFVGTHIAGDADGSPSDYFRELNKKTCELGLALGTVRYALRLQNEALNKQWFDKNNAPPVVGRVPKQDLPD